MLWGVDEHVHERFQSAGIRKENIQLAKDTYNFNFSVPPNEAVDRFRLYYGPTMNAFDAAEKNGKAEDLKRELQALFASQNKSTVSGHTRLPATFLRVTVTRS